MTTDLSVMTTVSGEVSDLVNARILAVSEDRIAGFVEEPFAAIATATGISEEVVIERLRAMRRQFHVPPMPFMNGKSRVFWSIASGHMRDLSLPP